MGGARDVGEGCEVSDVRSGWKWASRNLGVSVNIRACSMGVYASRSLGEDGGMKERVSMRQACILSVNVPDNERRGADERIQIGRPLEPRQTSGSRCFRRMHVRVISSGLKMRMERNCSLSSTVGALKMALPSRQVRRWRWSLCFVCRRWLIAGSQPTALRGVEVQPESSRGRMMFVVLCVSNEIE